VSDSALNLQALFYTAFSAVRSDIFLGADELRFGDKAQGTTLNGNLCSTGLAPAISGVAITVGTTSMNDKNPQARALAFKKCKGKRLKIAELGITPDQSEDATEAMIEALATAKAADKKVTDIAEFVSGQRWYVENLVRYSALTVEEQYQEDYDDAFAEMGSETEQLAFLSAIG